MYREEKKLLLKEYYSEILTFKIDLYKKLKNHNVFHNKIKYLQIILKTETNYFQNWK